MSPVVQLGTPSELDLEHGQELSVASLASAVASPCTDLLHDSSGAVDVQQLHGRLAGYPAE